MNGCKCGVWRRGRRAEAAAAAGFVTVTVVVVAAEAAGQDASIGRYFVFEVLKYLQVIKTINDPQ